MTVHVTLKPREASPFTSNMKTLSLATLVVSSLLFACGGAADVGSDVVAAEPAVLVGGFADPVAPSGDRKAQYPVAGQDLELSDGSATYRVMFGRTADGEALTARINDVAGATITASISDDGRLELATVETGPDAEITVIGGTAAPGLGLTIGDTARGE